MICLTTTWISQFSFQKNCEKRGVKVNQSDPTGEEREWERMDYQSRDRYHRKVQVVNRTWWRWHGSCSQCQQPWSFTWWNPLWKGSSFGLQEKVSLTVHLRHTLPSLNSLWSTGCYRWFGSKWTYGWSSWNASLVKLSIHWVDMRVSWNQWRIYSQTPLNKWWDHWSCNVHWFHSYPRMRWWNWSQSSMYSSSSDESLSG